ncbi:uncharacterized protein LOC121386669 isoform X2 [Gigantopelta aegis]|nr:uncharacterized protein LOC121386669 isoform X2 [Gigantopelta aegis]
MVSLIVGSGLLFALRSFRNVLAPPVVVVLDIFPETHFIIPTRFKQQKRNVLFTLDVLFSVVVIESLIIVTWRGLWELLDLYLFPDDTLKSGYYAFIISYVLVLLIQIAENPLQTISKKLEHTTMTGKVIFDDVIYLLQAAVAICHKRGLWLILNVVFFPSDQELSLWLNHAIGAGGLLLMCTLNSALPKGILIDGAQMDGAGVTMSISYAAVIVQWFRNRNSKEKQPSTEKVEMEQEQITFNPTAGAAV